MKIYGIWGVGGFGREVMPVAAAYLASKPKIGKFALVFVVDGKPAQERINGHEVWPADRFLYTDGEKHVNIAIASSEVRERIADICNDKGINPFSVYALNSSVSDSNMIGEGAILCPFTTITANARIGKFFHANIYSYVAHDCIIGNYVTFAPSVHCNGGTVIKDHAYIGTGAIIREARLEKPIVIGEGAIVGMGAVVTKSVEPFTTVIGNPAVMMSKH